MASNTVPPSGAWTSREENSSAVTGLMALRTWETSRTSAATRSMSATPASVNSSSTVWPSSMEMAVSRALPPKSSWYSMLSS